MRRKKVLLLDDDLNSIQLLQLRFEALGYEVFTGMDGLQGLIKVRKQMPDLIILDVMMPRLDGIEFFKILKQSDQYAGIPIIILTGRHDLRDRFIKMGCDYFATKPFQNEEIVSKAEELIKQHVLIVGDDHEFQEHIQASFPEDFYYVKTIHYPNELFQEIAKSYFHFVVIRLAQVSTPPAELMQNVIKVSKNPNILVVIYSDAYVKGFEVNDPTVISRAAVEWVKAGRVLFYDYRLHQVSLSRYLEENV